MNKYKKEQIRKHKEARAGLSPEEIKKLDEQDALEQQINDLARKLHVEKFPEEYDFMYDSFSDAKDRNRGKNPMSAEYIAKVEAKRKALGITPLGEDGLATSDDSWLMVYAEAEAKIKGSQ